MKSRLAARLGQIVVLGAVYLAAARFGLSLAFSAEQVTAVWPCTGLALAALLLLGYDVWPGIFAGAFLVNVTSHEPVATALGIAAGNTLEAVAGAWLLKSSTDFRPSLDRVRDVIRFITLAAGLSTMVSATIGVISLCLGGVHPWSEFTPLWLLWWFGDALGALIAAPVLLAWGPAGSGPREPVRVLPALVLTVLLIAADLVVFAGRIPWLTTHYPLEYLVFPLLIASGLCFRQKGTTTATLITSGIATWGTLRGFGPFGKHVPQENLVLLQLYTGVVAVTGLFLGAILTERREAEEQLRRADRHKDEFLAMLAHELRNPLAPISAAVEVLRLRGAADPALERQRDIIGRQVRHLARLVDDLLDVSRITQGKIVLREEPVDLSSALRQALQVGQALSTERRQRLEVTLPPGTVWVDGDVTRLVQVFSNVLHNAAKYTDAGGTINVSLAVEGGDETAADGRAHGQSRGSRRPPGPAVCPCWAVVRVRDSGRGISPDLLPRIFDMFVQGDRSLARSDGGLGIGLTLARRLVELHGGTIAARSEGPGAGTEFIIRLPAAGDGAARLEGRTEEIRPPAMIPPASKKRILVVDDNSDILETLAELLRLWGHEVRLASSGKEGLALAVDGWPEVVLLDIGMPEMDGYEVARRLRQDAPQSQARILALTGYGQEEDLRRSLALGFARHLTKPIDPAELREALGAGS